MAKRRMGLIALLFFICTCLLPGTAYAISTTDAVEPIDITKDCSLSLSYRAGDSAVSEVPVSIYRVAAVSADGSYTLTDEFADSGLVLNGIRTAAEWDVVRSTLEAYLLTAGINAGHETVSDASGTAVFDGLEQGLYLVVSGEVLKDDWIYVFSPALVSLPGLSEDGIWQYQVTASPKPEVIPPIGPDEKDEQEFQVIKLWKGDEGHDRPQRILIEIFRDGVSVETVELSEENHWSYRWTAKVDGARWMVVEREIPEGYTVTVDIRGTVFVLTNTLTTDVPPNDPPKEDPPKEDPPEDEDPPIEEDSPAEDDPTIEEEDPSDDEDPTDDPENEGDDPTESPKTGDTPHIMLYTVLMYVSGAILVILGITGKKKRV